MNHLTYKVFGPTFLNDVGFNSLNTCHLPLATAVRGWANKATVVSIKVVMEVN
jgi:hypothetical protein